MNICKSSPPGVRTFGTKHQHIPASFTTNMLIYILPSLLLLTGYLAYRLLQSTPQPLGSTVLGKPTTHSLTLPSNRRLIYSIYGGSTPSSTSPSSLFTLNLNLNLNLKPKPKPISPKFHTIIYLHGTPSSHHEAYLLSSAAQKHNVRMVAPSRPGSGGSSLHENLDEYSLLSYAGDILALADAVDATEFGIIGVSGGAPFAFAALHSLPKGRVMALGIASGIYPVTGPGGTKGMKVPSRVMMWVAQWAPGVVAWLVNMQLGRLGRMDGRDGGGRVRGMLEGGMDERERREWEAVGEDIKTAVVKSVSEGVRYGGWGAAWEMRLLGRDWGFGLGELGGAARVVMWHGERDENVPVAMAREAAGVLGKRAELKVVEGEGHGTLTMKMAEEIVVAMKGMMEG